MIRSRGVRRRERDEDAFSLVHFTRCYKERLPPTERPPFFTAAAIYPFILVSLLSSTALNLSYQRVAREREGARLRAQVSLLESLLARLRTEAGRALSEAEQEEIERELELVGLGRGAGKEVVDAESSVKVQTTWSEMLFGKKGKEYQEDKDETDWDAVLREADAAESARQAGRTVSTPAPTAAPSPRSTQPPSPAPSPASPTPSADSRPPPRGVYL
ncbi:hypothetical protein RTG_00367 [Rhodotorula toruloides ATCC 204091]|nr:hypothetical protein RTG_00367 [Rhodotorula toruloides ATCC 204091]PRQ72820.1 hypothetical protein AAT19DRAFT_16744 [Rhodotorula toruloides]